MQLKQNKKTPNLSTRDQRRKNKLDHDNQLPLKNKPSFIIHEKKKVTNKSISDHYLQTQKEITLEEYLTENEQHQIRKQVQRQVKKKVKGTQHQLQSGLIAVLEKQCNRLGQELEQEKLESQKRQNEIYRLRANISILNEKLEKLCEDNQSLTNNNNYGSMEKGQLRQEITSLKVTCKRKIDYLDFQLRQKDKTICELGEQLQNSNKLTHQLQNQLNNEKTIRYQLEQCLSQKTQEADHLRQTYQQSKKQWDQYRLSLEHETSKKLEKRCQKITKLQGEAESLSQKLREEEAMRKKMSDKIKQCERELTKKDSVISQMEGELVGLKKRNNDLSILKSSNNAILNDKLTKLMEQNTKLKEENKYLKDHSTKNIPSKDDYKPVLFGPNDED